MGWTDSLNQVADFYGFDIQEWRNLHIVSHSLDCPPCEPNIDTNQIRTGTGGKQLHFPQSLSLFGFFVSQLVNIDTDKVSGRRAPANALQTLSVTLAPLFSDAKCVNKTCIVFFLDVIEFITCDLQW